MTPMVAVGGWSAGFSMSALALVVGVIASAALLATAGLSPTGALLVLGFVPTLVLARTAMSDVAGLAVVACGLWLWWDVGRSRWRDFAGGVLAGASMLLREPNVLLLLPFLAEDSVRRSPGVGWRWAGLACGLGLRLMLYTLLMGNAAAVRATYMFSMASAPSNAVFYAAVLMVLVPGSVICLALDRGPRRWPLLAAVLGYGAVFLAWSYTGSESGGLKRLVLGPRYFAQATPLLALVVLRTGPRVVERWRLGWLTRVATRLVPVAIVVAAFAVHPFMAREADAMAEVRQAVATHLPRGAVVLSCGTMPAKTVHPVFGDAPMVSLCGWDPAIVRQASRGRGEAWLLQVDRFDSLVRRRDASANERLWDQALKAGGLPVFTQNYPRVGTVRIARLALP